MNRSNNCASNLYMSALYTCKYTYTCLVHMKAQAITQGHKLTGNIISR